jgi:hypothetical protein
MTQDPAVQSKPEASRQVAQATDSALTKGFDYIVKNGVRVIKVKDWEVISKGLEVVARAKDKQFKKIISKEFSELEMDLTLDLMKSPKERMSISIVIDRGRKILKELEAKKE